MLTQNPPALMLVMRRHVDLMRQATDLCLP